MKRYVLGDVVTVTGLTALEKDGSLDVYTGLSRLIIDGTLMLVVGALDEELRVLVLGTGELGRINAKGVVEYR